MNRSLVLLGLFALLFGPVWSQMPGPENYRIRIQKTDAPVKLDGVLDEPAWQSAEKARDFYMQFPLDTAYAVTRTEAMVSYDDQNVYVAAICYDEDAGNYTVQSLKRDFSYPVTDAFGVYFDPFLDKTNGFSFAVSPLNVQREGLIQNGGGFGVTTNWDNRWFSEVKQYPDRWVVEIAIPFKTLRFKEGETEWGINFSRNNLKQNENSAWSPVPRNFNIATMNYYGTLEWDQPLRKAGANVSLIPYVAGNYNADYANGTDDLAPNVGMDAKIAITSALNLDLTVNPDFSQVEVDRQVTNLSRFSLFFPERRQFFIENSDLFANFGFSRIRPFFSRQIGLRRGQAVPILAGARLSGKLNSKWRIGALNMQTEGVSEIGLRPQNYSAAVLQRQVGTSSNVTGIFVNRQGLDGSQFDGNDYNRVAGGEFNYVSPDARWRGKGFVQYSFDDSLTGPQLAHAVFARYQDQFWTFDYNHEWVDQNFSAEIGFVPRHQYLRLEPSVRRRFYPKKGPFIFHGPQAYLSWYWNSTDLQNIERQTRLRYEFQFNNLAQLRVGVEDWYVFLQNPFDPSRTGAPALSSEVGYDWRNVFVNYESDFRKRFNFGVYGNYGSYYLGEKLTYGGEINYRAQPYAVFSVQFEQNNIALPDTVVALSLISPRAEFAFTRSLFFTTFFQFNTQTQNFNINARLQWRFKPMSDLFVVLTDNYGTETLGIRNRAIALKLNYWFTL